jgi:hypothetical protein
MLLEVHGRTVLDRAVALDEVDGRLDAAAVRLALVGQLQGLLLQRRALGGVAAQEREAHVPRARLAGLEAVVLAERGAAGGEGEGGGEDEEGTHHGGLPGEGRMARSARKEVDES